MKDLRTPSRKSPLRLMAAGRTHKNRLSGCEGPVSQRGSLTRNRLLYVHRLAADHTSPCLLSNNHLGAG